jgi:hypothetical protein
MKIDQKTYPEKHFFMPSLKSQEICFLEYGHDGYQKKPIPKTTLDLGLLGHKIFID